MAAERATPCVRTAHGRSRKRGEPKPLAISYVVHLPGLEPGTRSPKLRVISFSPQVR